MIAEIIDGLFGFIDHEVVPLEEANRDLFEDHRQQYDDRGGYSAAVQDLMRTVRMASANAGYYTLFAPKALGGAELGFTAQFLIWEAIYERYGAGRLLPTQAVAHWASGPSFITTEISEELGGSVVSELMSGTSTACFAMSEPDAGSDVWGMTTRADRVGGSWTITGTKQWISYAPTAKYALVFAVTDEDMRRTKRSGISCFIVPMNSAGLSIDSVIRLFGQAGGNEAIISFSDVSVSSAQVVGELHHGFDLGIRGVSMGRMYNAGRCVGLARWALKTATEYAKERRVFGNPIADYQGVSFQLADSAIGIYTARAASLQCASELDQGKTSARNLAIVKAYATEMSFAVHDRCMQVLGGMGLTNETRLSDGWHQARMVRIADGSGEIMRRNIARALLKGDHSF
jgi:acyl-CoA dehydrogenase